ncbi:MAG: c-type cytochrome [Pseudomonadota bacterium]
MHPIPIALALLALAAGQACAADTIQTIPAGARLAATCTGCHGSNGVTAGTALPSLAGQTRENLLASLQAFKSGARPATIMAQITKGYSDEQLSQLAAYFSTQKAPNAGERP